MRYDYVAARYQELRFGAAVETAFEVVRREVDATIGDLVPDALPKLSAALESATSSNPEHWANAASTCRRLLKAAADVLRPPGPPVHGRQMGRRAVHQPPGRLDRRPSRELLLGDILRLSGSSKPAGETVEPMELGASPSAL